MSNDFSARHPRLLELFGIDLRSLALFRFALGLVLFIVLCQSFCDLTAFYGDLGVMPRSWAIESDSFNRVSLYFLNGQTWFLATLLTIQTLCALMLMLGWRTRLAVIVSFVMWASLINRNSLVLSSGDVLIACLLFWAMFLPLGARYSVDAATSSNTAPSNNQHLSWASAGLLLQVVSVYFFGALLKSGAEWHPQFTAAYYALSLDRYATPLGQWLLNFPELLQSLSALIWWLELLGPVLLFVPFFNRYIRLLILLCFVLMQIGLKLSLELGHYPFTSIAALTVFTSSWIWDALNARRQRIESAPLRIYYDRDCGFCLKSTLLIQQFLLLPRAVIAPAQSNPRAKALLEANTSWVVIDGEENAHMKWQAFTILLKHSPLTAWLWPLIRMQALVKPGNAVYDWVGRNRGGFSTITETLLPTREVHYEVSQRWQRVAAISIVAVFLWNLTTVNALPKFVSSSLTTAMKMVRIDQDWDQFAPSPRKDDGWMVIPAKLFDGSEIDLLSPEHAAPDYSKPLHYSQTHENIRWNTYRGHLAESENEEQRVYYGKYLCREWNEKNAADPAKRLMTFKLIYMLERTPAPGAQAQVEQAVLWRHECFPQETKGQVP
ncbi:HTTM domain-containing protein [Stenotrophobium rhamnosiphilum]|uniref:HTTM-like domain-containing protein n=1 Tax=Stenotrophobium rhamnosiphilum TaxID=2029166 RepID=A0A2T5MIB6_9GAMM|nr:HTTM domain-containing protein [Stenotrophobium rhamnosiphilum]PTU32327.1 hypothetical protein CJD38_06670 [Stenotrophobium rhamnosiphilum]